MSPAISPHRTTILVVEDEVLIRTMLADDLRRRDYAVIEATNADEALSILRRNSSVDLLLTDIRMPGMIDGAALVRLVRADFPAVKVVVVSGQLPERDVREPLDGYFSKPCDLSQLARHIQGLRRN